MIACGFFLPPSFSSFLLSFLPSLLRQSPKVAQDTLELRILLPRPVGCWVPSLKCITSDITFNSSVSVLHVTLETSLSLPYQALGKLLSPDLDCSDDMG